VGAAQSPCSALAAMRARCASFMCFRSREPAVAMTVGESLIFFCFGQEGSDTAVPAGRAAGEAIDQSRRAMVSSRLGSTHHWRKLITRSPASGTKDAPPPQLAATPQRPAAFASRVARSVCNRPCRWPQKKSMWPVESGSGRSRDCRNRTAATLARGHAQQC